jgi:hypothetical protein
MMVLRPGLEITLMVVAGLVLLLALWRALTAAEQRGWIRLHGVSKGSTAVAFAAMEDMFSASRSQARQLLEEQKRAGHRAPTPGDWLGDEPSATGRFAGKLSVSVNSPQAHEPDERDIITIGH